jgi:hypothetical protein
MMVDNLLLIRKPTAPNGQLTYPYYPVFIIVAWVNTSLTIALTLPGILTVLDCLIRKRFLSLEFKQSFFVSIALLFARKNSAH